MKQQVQNDKTNDPRPLRVPHFDTPQRKFSGLSGPFKNLELQNPSHDVPANVKNVQPLKIAICPTNPFTISKPRDQEICEFYVVQKRRTRDFEAPKL